jgi:hypothetical protein
MPIHQDGKILFCDTKQINPNIGKMMAKTRRRGGGEGPKGFYLLTFHRARHIFMTWYCQTRFLQHFAKRIKYAINLRI